MSKIFQGKALKTIIEKINTLEKINTFFFSENLENPKALKNPKKEKIDEILNFIKLKEHLLQKNYKSFHLKIAPNTYYTWTLFERQKFLKAHSIDHLCKTIIMKNTKFEKKLESKFYREFVCVIVQYTKSLNNEKLIKFLKNYQNENCEEIEEEKEYLENKEKTQNNNEVKKQNFTNKNKKNTKSTNKNKKKASRKMFNFRLASETDNLRLSGFRHNAVTPFMLNEDLLVVVTSCLKDLEGGYFWLGGGHENTKLRVGYQEFFAKSEYDVLEANIHCEK